MSEEQTQQLLYQMQILESYASSLDQKEAAIVSYLREGMASIESIKGISEKPEAESLVPVGIGTYVKASIKGDSKVLVDVGAGVTIEKNHDSAINYLEARIKELQVALNEASAQKQQTLMRLDQLKQEVNQLIQSANPQQ